MAVEALNVKGMLSNTRLARRVADASFGEFRRQLEYKAAQRGVTVAVIDRWYPSSKTCSACGVTHDRDFNAAKNILAESLRLHAEPIKAPDAGVSACGEEGAGVHRKTRVKPPSMKQEVHA